MPKHRTSEKGYESVEPDDISMSLGKIQEGSQVTSKDTGWTEEEKERMKEYGYDGLDMVRAWYS